MKKYLIILLLSCSVYSFGQEVLKEDKQLQIGIALGNALLPYQFNVIIPPIQISYGVALDDNFVLAGFLAYSNTRYDYVDYLYSTWPNFVGDDVHYRWTTNHIMFGLEARYYFADLLSITSSKFNPYGKFMLGYNAISYRKEVIKSHVDNLYSPYLTPRPLGGTFAGIAIGATYSVNEKIALFAELGHAISLLQLGINVRM